MNKLATYINENYLLDEVYQEIFGHKLSTGKFICPNPEHQHSSNTPSCKAYGNVFKCFGFCNRVFGPYDLLRWYKPQELERIKSEVIIKDTNTTYNKSNIEKVIVDKSQPISIVLTQITGI